MPMGGNDEIGLGVFDGNRSGQGALNAEDLRDTVAEIRINIDLRPAGSLEDEAGAAQPPGHQAALANMGFGYGSG